MKGNELLEAIDFKKLTVVELQMNFQELQEKYPEQKKMIFVTQSFTIEADLQMQLPEDLNEEPILGSALTQYELNPAIDIKNKELLNTSACIYLKNVKLTPIAVPGSPVYLEEFVLFSDHLLGVTTK